MKFYKYLIALLLLFVTTIPAQAVIRISPERFEFKVNSGNKAKFLNDSITVQIDGNESVRLKVYAESFDLTEVGALTKSIDNESNTKLLNSIRFNPTEFIVQPGDSQKIRFTILNPQQLNNGESRVVIFLEDVKSKSQMLQNLNNGSLAKINVKTRIAIPIYVDKGQIVKSGEISKFTLNKNKYDIQVKSTGNSKIRISGVGQIINGNNLVTEFPIESHPIQSGVTGKFTGELTKADLDPNTEYKLRINLFYKDQNDKNQTLTKEIMFKPSGINKL